MHLYFDLDCLAKLVACGLLEKTFDMFSVQPEEVYIVKTFPFTCQRKEKKYRKGRLVELAEAYHEAGERMKAFSTIELSNEEVDTLSMLSQIPDIDPGEAELLTAFCVDGESLYLCTGDKRCIKALDENKDKINNLENTLKGRIVHFEQLLSAFCKVMDFPALLELMTTRQAQDCDNVVKIAFHAGVDVSHSLESLAGYADYVNDFCISQEKLEARLEQIKRSI